MYNFKFILIGQAYSCRNFKSPGSPILIQTSAAIFTSFSITFAVLHDFPSESTLAFLFVFLSLFLKLLPILAWKVVNFWFEINSRLSSRSFKNKFLDASANCKIVDIPFIYPITVCLSSIKRLSFIRNLHHRWATIQCVSFAYVLRKRCWRNRIIR